MPRQVNIPGIGLVNFPDSMSGDEVNAASKKLYDDAMYTANQTAADQPSVSRIGPDTNTSAGPFDTVGMTGDFVPGPAEFGKRMVNAVADAGVGAAKGAVNTVSNLGTLLRKVPGVSQLDRLVTPIDVNTTPSNPTQTAGKFIEQGAEFMVPASKVAALTKAAKLTKGADLLARVAGQAGVSAAVTGAQSLDPTATAVSGVLGGVLPVVGEVAPKVANFVMNRTLRPAAHLRDEFMSKEAAAALGRSVENGETRYGASGIMEAVRKENVYGYEGAVKKLAAANKAQKRIISDAQAITEDGQAWSGEFDDHLRPIIADDSYVAEIQNTLRERVEDVLGHPGQPGSYWNRLESIKDLTGTEHEAAGRLNTFLETFVQPAEGSGKGIKYIDPMYLQQLKQDAQTLAYDSTLSEMNKSYYATLAKILRQTLEDVTHDTKTGKNVLGATNAQIQRLMLAKEVFQRAEERPANWPHTLSVIGSIAGPAFGHPYAGFGIAAGNEIANNPAVGAAVGQTIDQLSRPGLQRTGTAVTDQLIQELMKRRQTDVPR